MSAQASWLLLTGAGLLEIAWASALKYSDGLTRVWPSLLAVGIAAVSFALLALALRSIPVGIGYAVWVGIGSTGVALAGVLFHGEILTPPKLLCLSLVIGGIAGLKLLEGA